MSSDSPTASTREVPRGIINTLTNVQVEQMEERKAGEVLSKTDRMIQQLLGSVHSMQQQMQEQQQQIARLSSTARGAGTAADTLPTPMPSVRFPSTAARDGTHNRPSFGVPTYPFTPATPAPAHRRGGEPETDEAVSAEASGMEGGDAKADRKALKDALAIIKGFVEPFYADTTKDKGATVMDFVEKLETVMSDIVSDMPQYRLTIVRLFLREGAMRWMNAKVHELTGKAVNEGRSLEQRPLDWDTEVRRPFIEAHVGTDTVELWLSKLSLLRLGAEKTKTPIEFDSQFDTIARHVYPAQSSGDKGVDLLLATKYGEAIAASAYPNQWLFLNIVRMYGPTTLQEWKTALTKQWNAEEKIKAAQAVQKAAAGQSSNKGAGGEGNSRGQGHGHGGKKTFSERAPAESSKVSAANATDTDSSIRREGQPSAENDVSDPQLNAANGTGGNQGGGRGGGGGGRGRDARTSMSAERQRLYDEQRCFRCKEVGHTQQHCSKPPTPQPSKA